MVEVALPALPAVPPLLPPLAPPIACCNKPRLPVVEPLTAMLPMPALAPLPPAARRNKEEILTHAGSLSDGITRIESHDCRGQRG